MRKFLIPIFVLTMVIVLALCPMSVSADGRVDVTVDIVSYPTPGESFEVDITVANNPGVTSISFTLDYNFDNMSFEKIEFASFLTEDDKITTSSNKNSFTISSTEPLTRNGVYLTVRFKLSSSAGLGKYPISLSSGKVTSAGGSVSASVHAGGVDLQCYHKYRTNVVKPTCSSEGYTEHRCSECSISYISDYIDRLPHDGVVVSTTSATCTRAGSRLIRCKVCGNEVSESVGKPLGHDYVSNIIEPTCYRGGYTDHVCSRCGDSYRDSVTEMTEHKYAVTFTKPSTCSDTGFDLYSCAFCGISYQQTIPTLEHKWTVEVSDATHERGGWSLYTCDVCGLSMRGDFTELKEYSYEFTVLTQATCTSSGQRKGVCADGCGHVIYEDIPPLGHEYGEWRQLKAATYFDQGEWESVCTVCGERVVSYTPRLEYLPSSQVLTLPFWKQVINRTLESTVAVAVLIAVFCALTVLIFFAIVRSVRVKMASSKSLRELERLAEQCEKFRHSSAPIGFDKDYGFDFSKPDGTVMLLNAPLELSDSDLDEIDPMVSKTK